MQLATRAGGLFFAHNTVLTSPKKEETSVSGCSCWFFLSSIHIDSLTNYFSLSTPFIFIIHISILVSNTTNTLKQVTVKVIDVISITEY